MTSKQKAGMLSGLVSVTLNGVLWIMLLRHVQAPAVIWLMFWFCFVFGMITTCLIKYIFEIK